MKEDFFEGLSNSKKGTTNTINNLVDMGYISVGEILDFKIKYGLSEKQIIEEIRLILLEK